MNKRVRDLAEHCDFYVGNEHSDKSYEDKQVLWVEKFAQLIVEECASYMVKNYPNTRYQVNYMRKHMGDPNWNKPL